MIIFIFADNLCTFLTAALIIISNLPGIKSRSKSLPVYDPMGIHSSKMRHLFNQDVPNTFTRLKRIPQLLQKRSQRHPQLINSNTLSFHRTISRPELPNRNNSPSDDLKIDQRFGFMSSEEASESTCKNLPGLSDHQRSLCLGNPGLVWAMVDGTQLGLYECVHQFKNDKWNCSAAKVIYLVHGGFKENLKLIENPMAVFSTGNLVSGLPELLKKGSRETAFMSAAWAAGTTQTITRACSRGRISTCDCDPFRREGKSRDTEGEFSWGGCSDPIRFGMRLTRLFLDSNDIILKEKISQWERDSLYKKHARRVRGSQSTRWNPRNSMNKSIRTNKLKTASVLHFQQNRIDLKNARLTKSRLVMDLHNRKVGRRLIWQQREKKCKCHGVSGACSLRTCWQRASQFRVVGDMLKMAYQNAIHTTYDADSGQLLRNSDVFYGDIFSDSSKLNPSKPDKHREGRSSPLKWLVVNSASEDTFWNKKLVKKRSFKRDVSIKKSQKTQKNALHRFKDTLIYLESSPDYCYIDRSIGHLGVAGRQCEVNTYDQPNSCNNICCDRGYDTIETETTEKCDCKFVWCCEVKCKVCRKKTLIHRCRKRSEDNEVTDLRSAIGNSSWTIQQHLNNNLMFSI